MQFLVSALVVLAPLTVIATPVADPKPVAPTPIAEVVEIPVAGRSPAEIFGRSNQYCAIVSNDGTVKCRAGPGTGYDVVATVNDGDIYLFHCYKSGTCYQEIALGISLFGGHQATVMSMVIILIIIAPLPNLEPVKLSGITD